MEYESQIEVIWAKILAEGSPRRPTTSRTSFDNIVTVFTQAENGEYSGASSIEVATFRAEYNIWAYYFGEEVQFPGLDPATGQMVAVAHPSAAPLSGEAADMQRQIQSLWIGRSNRVNYHPQMGWNPETGEPWMSFRAYAENSYPALSGSHNCYLRALERQNSEFVVQYERFPHMGYTLLWPEFAHVADLKNQATWKNFNRFRAFLNEWSSIVGVATNINDAFEEYRSKPEDERPDLPVPPGFNPNIAQIISDGHSRRALSHRAPHRVVHQVRPRREEDDLRREASSSRSSGRRIRVERRRRYRPRRSQSRDRRHSRDSEESSRESSTRSRSDSSKY